jgi:hypothetical protein
MSKQDKKPVSGTKEWASHVQNLQNGCEHDCLYCFAKTQAIRFGNNTIEGWKTPVINQKVLTKGFGKKQGTIMFPTTHDITPQNIEQCIVVLRRLLEVGNKVLIVSKPRLECVRQLCLMLDGYQKQVLFRFTIGSADDEVLKYWEPNAPSFKERIACLKFARHPNFDGFAPDPTSTGGAWQTSVSCEPMLDRSVGFVIAAARPYVTDAIWLGKPNKLKLRVAMNSPNDTGLQEASDKLFSLFSDDFIFDLYNIYKSDPMIKWKDSIKQIPCTTNHIGVGIQ